MKEEEINSSTEKEEINSDAVMPKINSDSEERKSKMNAEVLASAISKKVEILKPQKLIDTVSAIAVGVFETELPVVNRAIETGSEISTKIVENLKKDDSLDNLEKPLNSMDDSLTELVDSSKTTEEQKRENARTEKNDKGNNPVIELKEKGNSFLSKMMGSIKSYASSMLSGIGQALLSAGKVIKVGLLVSAVYNMFKQVIDIFTKDLTAGEGILGIATSFIEGITLGFFNKEEMDAWLKNNNITSSLDSFVENYINPIFNSIFDLMFGIKSFIENPVKFIKDNTEGLLTSLESSFEYIKNLLSPGFENIKSYITGIFDDFLTVFDFLTIIKNNVLKKFEEFWNNFKEIIDNMLPDWVKTLTGTNNKTKKSEVPEQLKSFGVLKDSMVPFMDASVNDKKIKEMTKKGNLPSLFNVSTNTEVIDKINNSDISEENKKNIVNTINKTLEEMSVMKKIDNINNQSSFKIEEETMKNEESKILSTAPSSNNINTQTSVNTNNVTNVLEQPLTVDDIRAYHIPQIAF